MLATTVKPNPKSPSKKQIKVFRWRVERLGNEGTRGDFQKGLTGSVQR